jgi:hypothetical protein
VKIPAWVFDWIADTVDGDADELLRLIGAREDLAAEEVPRARGDAPPSRSSSTRAWCIPTGRPRSG